MTGVGFSLKGRHGLLFFLAFDVLSMADSGIANGFSTCRLFRKNAALPRGDSRETSEMHAAFLGGVAGSCSKRPRSPSPPPPHVDFSY